MSYGEKDSLERHGYILGKLLGSGAYGKVMKATYRGKDSGPRLTVATKTINTSKLPALYIEKFLPRELEVVRWLDHPNVVRAHSIVYRRGIVYIFMEFVENGTLLKYLKNNKKLSEAKCQIWFRQILGGLLYLHRNKHAHRDVKCDNVLITKQYNLKVCDFGFARLIVDRKGSCITSTTYCGTPSYCPPEILEGVPYYPTLADAWSTGVTLYVLMCQSMPFGSKDTRLVLREQKQARWKFTAFVDKNFSKDSRNVVSAMLVADPQKRANLFKISRHKWLSTANTKALVRSAVKKQQH
ncbi:unnamed protein product [Darwinula stevensoni]|uniref:Protein kinase domain-containing protein n=1 Tax=Darwinula stevensoni TaxID=69355 RepID=A0A7R8XKD3_9CRUS|nr:unnamed protein product [Darwinula stevensoni]CAG0893026.1 unnamed protein product [Darwinula stevensoni]